MFDEFQKKKGFSNELEVPAARFAFAREGITWSRQQVQKQAFSDEVWAMERSSYSIVRYCKRGWK